MSKNHRLAPPKFSTKAGLPRRSHGEGISEALFGG
jgi:hypothetical protein